jgi:fibronectin-binding autotransporter adhesin
VLTLGGGVTLQGGTAALQGSATIGSATQGITQTGNATYDPGTGNTLTIDGAVTSSEVANIDKTNNNGTLTFNRAISLSDGNLTGNGGILNLNNGVTLATATDRGLLIAANGNVMNLAGTSNVVRLGVSTGTVNIGTGASVTMERLETTRGGSTTSVINQTGGTLTVTGNNSSDSNNRSILMGHWGSGSSNYNLSGGVFNVSNAFIGLGWDSSANFNQTGGTVNARGIGIGGRNNAAQYNLEGGRLNLGDLGINGTASNKQINLGGGTLGASANWSSTQGVVFTGINGDVVIDTLDSVDGTTARTIALNGVASGAGGFSKINAGNLVFGSATGTFNGTGRVSGGSLFLSDNAAQSATIIAQSGGTLRAGTPTTAGTAAVAALQLDSGSSSIFRIGGTGDRFNISGSNAFSTEAAAGHGISILPTGQVFINDTFILFDYAGSIGGAGFAGLVLNALPNPHYAASLIDNTADTRVDLKIDSIDAVLWRGTNNNTWDVENNENWITESDSQDSLFYTFDVVKFDDNSPSATIDLVGTITPATVAFNSTNNHTLTGSGIGGAGGLTKAGSGTLTLLNNNTYTGAVSIAAGSVVVGNGGTTGTLGGAGTINVSTGASLTFNRSDAQTLTRSVTGGGTLFSNGGNFTLNAGNNAVDIVVNSGTFFARGGNWSTSFAANRTITVNATGILDTTTHALGGLGGATRPNNIILNEDAVWKLNNEQQLPNVALTMHAGIVNGPGDARGSGTIVTLAHATKSSVINAPLSTGNGAITFNVADGAVAVDLSVAGNIVGGNAITKTGAGTMVLSGTNTYTGATNVNVGTLLVNGDNSAATGTVTVASAATLGGTGTVGGATAISGSLTAGNSIGKLSFGSNLTLNAGSTFAWELSANETGRGSNYDAVNVGGTLGGSDAVFKAVLTSGSFADAFWTTNRQWTNIFMNSAEDTALDFASIFSSFQYWEGGTDVTPGTISTYGSFSISGSTLNWTAIPEPSSALAGLLLGFGLLRRRRKVEG